MAATKLDLPTVTLCAATSVNVEATIAALRSCLDQVDFADCLLMTDVKMQCDHPGIRVVPIARLNSSRDYSDFILNRLIDHVATSHCLVVQWDGFVVDIAAWQDDFLDFDYIGAPWPQFHDGNDVGNGGFSLRSRKLLEACRDPSFMQGHPEDIAICRVNREILEGRFGIRFAHLEYAKRFAHERGGHREVTFGFHGVFNMMTVLGTERFWELYLRLDDPSTAFADYRTLMSQLKYARRVHSRRVTLTKHWLWHCLNRVVASGSAVAKRILRIRDAH